MNTLNYLMITFGCLVAVGAFGLLMAEINAERRERYVAHLLRQWRNGRIEE